MLLRALVLFVLAAAFLAPATASAAVPAFPSAPTVTSDGAGGVNVSGTGATWWHIAYSKDKTSKASSYSFPDIPATTTNFKPPAATPCVSIIMVQGGNGKTGGTQGSAWSPFTCATTTTPPPPPPPTSGPWLGINSLYAARYLGPDEPGVWTNHKIVWDRSDDLEVTAGATTALVNSLKPRKAAGIRSDVIVNQASTNALTASGLVATMRAVLTADPAFNGYFELINEPYYKHYSGAAYADLVLASLTAVKNAGLPLNRVLVAAFGAYSGPNGWDSPLDGHGWMADMIQRQPTLPTLIQGWYSHAYGSPDSEDPQYPGSRGMGCVVRQRNQVLSLFKGAGANNWAITEYGWHVGGPTTTTSIPNETTKSAYLQRALNYQLPWYTAGWLKASIFYDQGKNQTSTGGYWNIYGEVGQRPYQAFGDLHG
jgi:hypothetical protein